jgi:hypothetical protein
MVQSLASKTTVSSPSDPQVDILKSIIAHQDQKIQDQQTQIDEIKKFLGMI